RHAVHFAVRPEDDTPLGSTKPRRVLKERCQYQLKIERRAAYELEHFRCGCLLVERLGKVSVACLELIEQSHVLYRYDALVGEGFQERNVAVGEPAWLLSCDSNHADRRVIAHHRHVNKASEATRPTHLTLVFSGGRGGLDVAPNPRHSLVHPPRPPRDPFRKNLTERLRNYRGVRACP